MKRKLSYNKIFDIANQNLLFEKSQGASGESISSTDFSNALISAIALPDLGDVSSLYLSDIYFEAVQIKNRNLYGINLYKSRYDACIFSKSVLRKAVFAEVVFRNTVFYQCDLTRTQFINCHLQNCIFDETNFSGAVISRSTISNSVLSGEYNGLLDENKIISSVWGANDS